MSAKDETVANALAAYVDVLARGTRYANDRPKFTEHLARAAEMFSAHHTGDSERLRKLIEAEIRCHGWSYLRSPEGDAVSAAWEKFAGVALGNNDNKA